MVKVERQAFEFGNGWSRFLKGDWNNSTILKGCRRNKGCEWRRVNKGSRHSKSTNDNCRFRLEAKSVNGKRKRSSIGFQPHFRIRWRNRCESGRWTRDRQQQRVGTSNRRAWIEGLNLHLTWRYQVRRKHRNL